MKPLKISIAIVILALLAIYEFVGFSIFNASVPDNNSPKKFYVINLDRTPERFLWVKKQADEYNIPLERYIATDGYNVVFVDQKTKESFTGEEIKNNKLVNGTKYDIYCSPPSDENKASPDFIYDTSTEYKRLFSAGETGLICSARKLWKKIADGDDQIAVIFEDDVILNQSFDKNLQHIFDALPTRWDIVYLDSTNHSKSTDIWFKELKTINNYLIKVPNRQNVWGMYAYIINKSSAKKLLKLYDQYSHLPLDSFLSKVIRKSKIHAFISKNKIAGVKSENSEIQKMGRDPKYL